MSDEETVRYHINDRDEIVFVNSAWERFARDNDAPHLSAETVTGKSLWDFITDPATEQIYREILGQVRAGQTSSFDFRCDSPDLQRLRRMKISLTAEGDVEFETHSLWDRERDPPPIARTILKRGLPRAAAALVIVCGWCKKFEVGEDDWLEIEKAVPALGLFKTENPPLQLSHGMCPPCYAEMSAKIERRRSVRTAVEAD